MCFILSKRGKKETVISSSEEKKENLKNQTK